MNVFEVIGVCTICVAFLLILIGKIFLGHDWWKDSGNGGRRDEN